MAIVKEAVLVIITLSIFSALLGFSWEDRVGGFQEDYSFYGFKTSYYLSPSGDPEFVILVMERSGRPLRAIYSLYYWDPNGYMQELGVFGGYGVVRINYSIIYSFSSEWLNYLRSRGNDPKFVSPGLILMGAIHENNSIYDSIRSVPIRIEDVISRKSVSIEIIEDLGNKKPLKILNNTNGSQTSAVSQSIKPIQSQWPPGNINDYCNAVPWYVECYYWVLEENYGSKMGVPLPIVAAKVGGPDADKVDIVSLRAYYKSTSSVSLKFIITASVGSPLTPIDYRVVGASMTLREDKVWLDQYVDFRSGIDYTPPAILGIGFLGDIAAARYRLYVMTCPWGFCSSTPTDTLANMTLMRPSIVDNQMISYIMKDQDPYDGQGILENALRYYMLNWAWSRDFKSQKSIFIDVFKVIDDLNTYPIFSGSIDVLGILCGVWGIACEIARTAPSVLGASVGVEVSNQVYMLLVVSAYLRDEYVNTSYWIWANYFYSPSTLLYGSSRSYIGSLYADIYVYRQ